jgi:uncharacterized protein YwqG
MGEAHDRRAFFKELLRGAVQAAGEVGSLIEPERPAADEEVSDATELRQETVPAAAARRLASGDDLRELCAELGLEAWADEAVALARSSIRLTRGAGRGSRLGGVPDVPASFEWPRWQGEELTLVTQVHLAELPESALPRSGTLLVFFALAAEPAGQQPADAGGCSVMFVAEGPTDRADGHSALPELAVVPSAELTLPLEPASVVREAADLEAWMQLREQLAALQGVEAEDRAEDYHALHRLLGYPDTLADDMELDAQLVANGVDLTGADRYFDPRITDLEPGAADWRLLFQLSSDTDLGVSLGDYGRLYVWIREDDLRAGRFHGVRAFVR